MTVYIFDTIFLITTGKASCLAAIIKYWLMPLSANGHCFQPHNTMIITSTKGFVIANEDFIPENFYIEKVTDDVTAITISGVDYDCGGNKNPRNFKVGIDFRL